MFLLLKGSRIIIPASMELEMFGTLHHAHQGIQNANNRHLTVARVELSISKLSEQLLNLLQGETPASRTSNAMKHSHIAIAEGVE